MRKGMWRFLATCLVAGTALGAASCGREAAQADIPAAAPGGTEQVASPPDPQASAQHMSDAPEKAMFSAESMAHLKAMGRKGCESNLMTNRWYDCGCYGDVVGEAYAQSRLEKEAEIQAALDVLEAELGQSGEAYYQMMIESRKGGDISDLGDLESFKAKILEGQRNQMRRTYKLDKDPMMVKYLEVMSGAAFADVSACKAQEAVHAKILEDCARNEAISNHREDPTSFCACEADETVRLWTESALGLNGIVSIMSKAGVTCAQKYPAEPF